MPSREHFCTVEEMRVLNIWKPLVRYDPRLLNVDKCRFSSPWRTARWKNMDWKGGGTEGTLSWPAGPGLRWTISHKGRNRQGSIFRTSGGRAVKKWYSGWLPLKHLRFTHESYVRETFLRLFKRPVTSDDEFSFLFSKLLYELPEPHFFTRRRMWRQSREGPPSLDWENKNNTQYLVTASCKQ